MVIAVECAGALADQKWYRARTSAYIWCKYIHICNKNCVATDRTINDVKTCYGFGRYGGGGGGSPGDYTSALLGVLELCMIEAPLSPLVSENVIAFWRVFPHHLEYANIMCCTGSG